MLRSPKMLVASLVFMVCVVTYNYFHFFGGKDDEKSPRPEEDGREVASSSQSKERSRDRNDAESSPRGPRSTNRDRAGRPSQDRGDKPSSDSPVDQWVGRLGALQDGYTARHSLVGDVFSSMKSPFDHPQERRQGKTLTEIQAEIDRDRSREKSAQNQESLRPVPTASSLRLQDRLARLEVRGIIHRDGQSLAIVGQELVRVGDVLLDGEAKITAIEKRAVVITVGDEVVRRRLQAYRATRSAENEPVNKEDTESPDGALPQSEQDLSSGEPRDG